jgi:hypothetical protein
MCPGCLESIIRVGAKDDGSIQKGIRLPCACRVYHQIPWLAMAVRVQTVNAHGSIQAKFGKFAKYIVMIGEMLETGVAPK